MGFNWGFKGLKPPSSSELLLLGAPDSLLSLSPTSSDIRFRGRNQAFLRTLITDCLLRNEYPVLFIITRLKQAVT